MARSSQFSARSFGISARCTSFICDRTTARSTTASGNPPDFVPFSTQTSAWIRTTASRNRSSSGLSTERIRGISVAGVVGLGCLVVFIAVPFCIILCLVKVVRHQKHRPLVTLTMPLPITQDPQVCLEIIDPSISIFEF